MAVDSIRAVEAGLEPIEMQVRQAAKTVVQGWVPVNPEGMNVGLSTGESPGTFRTNRNCNVCSAHPMIPARSLQCIHHTKQLTCKHEPCTCARQGKCCQQSSVLRLSSYKGHEQQKTTSHQQGPALRGQKRICQLRLKEVCRKQTKNLHERFVASDIAKWSFKAHGLCLQGIKNTHTHTGH